ncbi:hypothetical protein CEXT_797221 [Caerostris extrusa]|uniref:Secreted protein n=1 Tax=Caerostris extrusa TaxID=172846 RepID=A0AAV4RAE0_CAEEX|nr:hypothetical protein CEXT_797221 [Caerostris extrusa]
MTIIPQLRAFIVIVACELSSERGWDRRQGVEEFIIFNLILGTFGWVVLLEGIPGAEPPRNNKSLFHAIEPDSNHVRTLQNCAVLHKSHPLLQARAGHTSPPIPQKRRYNHHLSGHNTRNTKRFEQTLRLLKQVTSKTRGDCLSSHVGCTICLDKKYHRARERKDFPCLLALPVQTREI